MGSWRTWADGTTGANGTVTAANSLVGSTAGDKVGFYGVTKLTNGNFVVISPFWDNGAFVDAGAVTFRNGSAPIIGVVDASNSPVGSQNNDQLGIGGSTPLINGNYVVSSYLWDNSTIIDAGATTWGSGTAGVTGTINASNSLVGGSTDDQVSNNGVTALTNGNYVVSSPLIDAQTLGFIDVGAATWGNGSTGSAGVVDSFNSVVGDGGLPNDRNELSSGGITPLSNGNYVISPPRFTGDPAGVGAVTWINGSMATSGGISNTNSLVGTSENDAVGIVYALDNGNYVVLSPTWNDQTLVDAGAVSFVDGSVGLSGPIFVTHVFPDPGSHHAIGQAANSGLQFPLIVDNVNHNFYGRFLTEGGGRVRVGSQTSGFLNIAPTSLSVSNVIAVPENTIVATRMKVADITVVDDALGDIYPTLSGADADKFELEYVTRTKSRLYLKAGVMLDHEVNPHLDVTINVNDEGVGNNPDLATTFQLDVTDVNEAPTVTLQNTTISLAENTSTAAAIKVADIVVTDDALGTKTLTLSGVDAARFQIVGTELRLKAGTALNFESQSSYAVTVNVDDATIGSSPDSSVSYALNLTDANETPVVTAKQFLIGENSGNGAFIGTIPANDVDAGQTKTYAITAGNLNNAFRIHPTSGVLTVNNSAALNFETTTQFDLTVTVTDNGAPANSGSAPVTVFLRDVNDVPVVAAKQFLIGENSVNNAFIGTIPATDQDAGQTKTFSIVAGNTSNAFAIDPTTGTLKVNNSSVLDFETTQKFDLTIRVVDNGAQPSAGYGVTTVFLRDANDAPTVTAKDFLIGENSTNGAYIGKTAATDADSGQSVTFAIIAGNSNNAFAIDPVTGTLTVNNSAALNFEVKSEFELTIRATDNGSPAKAGTAIVRVFLRDVNEAPMVTAKQFLISENSVNGAFIGSIPATDQDAGQTKTYSILGGNIGDAFAIHPTTGALSVNNSAALDFETRTQFQLIVRVVDNGNPAQAGTAAVTVFLRDVVGARSATMLSQETTTMKTTASSLSDDATNVASPSIKRFNRNPLSRLFQKPQ